MSTSTVTHDTLHHDGVAFGVHRLHHRASSHTYLQIYEYGAHITDWCVAGQDILYCSKQAVYAPGKGIRGTSTPVHSALHCLVHSAQLTLHISACMDYRRHTGMQCTVVECTVACLIMVLSVVGILCSVQLVFPQFGPSLFTDSGVAQKWRQRGHTDTNLPQHGFARTTTWQYVDSAVDDSTGDVTLTMVLHDSEQTRAEWPHAFTLTYTVTLRASSLTLHLQCSNNGEQPFDFCTLLHSYLHVPDVSQCRIIGLSGIEYIDKPQGGKHCVQQGDITIEQETDRIYCSVPYHDIHLHSGATDIIVRRDNLPDAVVWNPYIDKAKAMSDMADADYKRFVCIEPGYVCTIPAYRAHGKICVFRTLLTTNYVGNR